MLFLASKNLGNSIEATKISMVASRVWRGLLSLHLVAQVFLGPLDEDVDIQFHASYIN